MERAKDGLKIGAKVTTRNDFFEDDTDALLMEISKMSFISKAPLKELVLNYHLS